MILAYVETCKGDSKIKGFDKDSSKHCFTLNSFEFNVERELTDSAKGGTDDVNMGVAEMQECSFGKSMDAASPGLAAKAMSGASCGCAEIYFTETVEDGSNNRVNQIYLTFKLDNVFVKTWSIDGSDDDRPSENVTLWYNKMAFSYFATPDGKQWKGGYLVEWDASKSARWDSAISDDPMANRHPA